MAPAAPFHYMKKPNDAGQDSAAGSQWPHTQQHFSMPSSTNARTHTHTQGFSSLHLPQPACRVCRRPQRHSQSPFHLQQPTAQSSARRRAALPTGHSSQPYCHTNAGLPCVETPEFLPVAAACCHPRCASQKECKPLVQSAEQALYVPYHPRSLGGRSLLGLLLGSCPSCW
jgi:hypothetical protein